MFRKYTVDAYKDALKNVNFPNCELFDDVNEAYSNFFQKIRAVIDNTALGKTKSFKENTQKWFHGQVLGNINTRDKLFKRSKNSRLYIDKELFKKAKYNILKLIIGKNEHILMTNFENISENQNNYGNLEISRHAKENTDFKFQCR